MTRKSKRSEHWLTIGCFEEATIQQREKPEAILRNLTTLMSQTLS